MEGKEKISLLPVLRIPVYHIGCPILRRAAMSRRGKDLTGKRFGRLTVLQRSGTRHNSILWSCICDCGTKVKVTSSNFRCTRSCGCLQLEIRTKHGLYKHPLYMTWANIIRRCGNSDYGESYISVTVCEQWKNSVEEFVKYVETTLGDKPSKEHSIDRIENSKGYEPGNIRWATKKEQSNNRRYVRKYEFKGEIGTIRYFCDKYGVNFHSVRTRLHKGETICQALRVS